MKKLFILIYSLFLVADPLFSQNIGIGTTSPATSAQLDVTSTSKGLLIPRMTGSQRNAIASPVAGLIVYQTNFEIVSPSSPGFYVYESGGWKRIARADEIAGGTSTWTVNGADQYSNVAGSVGIGISAPNVSALLDLTSTSKGFLLPRMTTAQRNAIASPTAGLMVFDNSLKELFHYDGGSWRGILNSNDDYWDKSSTRNWVYNTTDSIGMGTSSPDERFHLYNGKMYMQDNRTNQNPFVIFDNPNISYKEGGMMFKRSGDTLATVKYVNNPTTSNYIEIDPAYSSGGTRTFFSTNGVGIGYTDPQVALHIRKPAADEILRLEGNDPMIKFRKYVSALAIDDIGFIQTVNDDLRIGTYSSNTTGDFIVRTGSNDRLFVIENGNVAIGNYNTPKAKLHIPDGDDADLSSTLNGYLMLGLSTGSNSNIIIDNNEILARTGASTAGTLFLQNDGGEVSIGAKTTINKNGEALKLNGTDPAIDFYQGGVFKSFIQQSGNDLLLGNNAGDIHLDVATPYNINMTTHGGAILLSPSGASVLVNPSNGGNVLLSPTGGGDVVLNPNSGGFVQLNPTGGGNVAIGTIVSATAATYKLTVTGKILCEELRVKLQSSGWPDYVFDDSYHLLPINEVEKFIQQNKHLPGIPSAAEIEKEGIAVGDMQKRMMEKIEQLTLYIIEQQKQIDELKKMIKQ